jgi:subtilisin family serine protease
VPRYIVKFRGAAEPEVRQLLDAIGVSRLYLLPSIESASFDAPDNIDLDVFSRVGAVAWLAERMFTLGNPHVEGNRPGVVIGEQSGAVSTPIGILDHGVCAQHRGLTSVRSHKWIDPDLNFHDCRKVPSTNAVAHGTFVTGIACGVAPVGMAPGAPIHIVEAGRVSLSDAFFHAVEQLVGLGCKVINVSMYSETPIREQDTHLQWVRSKGALPVVAVGNKRDVALSPSDSPFAFAVGNCYSDGTIADDSGSAKIGNRIVPAVVAPGRDVWSTFTDTCAEPLERFSTSDGTSFSSPYVAGLAARLFHECKTATVDQVEEAIRATAVKPTNLDPTRCEKGMVCPYEALEYLRKRCSRSLFGKIWGPFFSSNPYAPCPKV